jgi:hypothetical protein
MPPLIHAEADLGTLIYIIIVFLWVIGNVLGKSKKKRGRGGAPVPRAGESSAEQELREFLEKLAGKPEEPEEVEEEQTRPQPAPQPRPARTATQPAPHPRQARTSVSRRLPAEPTMPTSPSFNVSKAAPAGIEDITELDVEKLARELREASPFSGNRSGNVLSSMESIFTKSAPVMPSMRYAFSSTSPRPERPVVSRDVLKDRDSLRRLYASRVILGPPRALDPFQADTEATRSS